MARRSRRAGMGSFADEYYTGEGEYPSFDGAGGMSYPEALDAVNSSGVYYPDFPVDENAGNRGALERFADAARRFQSTYAEFSMLPIAESDPQYGEYLNLAGRMQYANDTMQSIAEGARGAWDWARDVMGLSGARAALAAVPGVGGLGAVPVLTWAAITGAVALLIAATNSMIAFMVNWRRRQAYLTGLDEINLRRAEEGKPPIEAAEDDAGGPSMFGDAAKLAKWVAVGAVIWFAAPPIVRALEKK